MANILGISIGTRNVGVAVIKLRMLTDYRIRTFPGKWTPKKCDSIWDAVEVIIKRSQITDIAIKVPKPSHCSENIDELIRGISELCKWFKIRQHSFTTEEVKLLCTGTAKTNKGNIAIAIIDKYPELKDHWHNGNSNKAYNAKLFEEIACAELALRAGH